MGTSMVSFAAQKTGKSRWRLWLALVATTLVWMLANPQGFLNLWLTPDQQGRLWFELGEYERASRVFEDPRWRGFSLYAGEDFSMAERYFSQYQDAESLLARANALAHQTNYAAAKRAYEELAGRYPDHPASAVNLAVIEAIIKATEEMPQSEDDRGGKPGGRPGDGTSSAEGNEAQGAQELEQYNADQLLQDPALTQMWLQQIQRDPSEFLTTQFYLQLEQEEGSQ
jgi:Ca-activated chloride channel homolog